MVPVTKPMLRVSEAAELLGLSWSAVYELLYRKEIPSTKLGNRWIIPRRALLAMVGVGDERKTEVPPNREPEPDEWTYVVTVKRLRAGERVQVYSDTEPFKRCRDGRESRVGTRWC
ncbi:MAG: helix-turn-helix domain-containing protein [Dehalococcoidia bacterium]|nr:helix-turn-helix domain-containing protein [Dehalococcoidia bacterium]